MLARDVGELGVADHVWFQYRSPAELVGQALPYVRGGLERGEQCVFIADAPTRAALEHALGAQGVDVDTAQRSGALAILRREETYLGDGSLAPAAMLAWWEDRCAAAIASGFSALRAVGEMLCIAGPEPGRGQLVAYEADLNGLTPTMPISFLCAYHGSKFVAPLLRKSLLVHPQLLLEDVVYQNPCFAIGAHADVEHLIALLLRLGLQHVASQGIFDAIEAERRFLARELHDDLGQLLSTIQMDLQALVAGPQPARIIDLEQARAMVGEAVESVRSVALSLRPSALDDLGLSPALRSLIRREEQRGELNVVQDLDDLEGVTLTASLSTTCFRVCQEALRNIRLHARTHEVRLSIRRQGEYLELLVHDDGVGFDVAARRADPLRLGLLGMEERVEVAGGQLWIDSVTGQGTTIRARLPLDQMDPPMSVTVVLADDHALVRAGVRALLERLPGIEVVGEAGTGQEALRLVGEHHPRLAFLNISLPELNGLDATQRITRDQPGTSVIILSLHADEEYVRRAISVGAVGYLLKSADRRELEMAVQAVLAGDVWLSPSVSKTVIAALVRGHAPSEPFELLTGRQREILQLVAEGHSTKEIAHRLGLSPKTIDAHRAQLMKRLDVHSVPALVRCAMRLGLVRPES